MKNLLFLFLFIGFAWITSSAQITRNTTSTQSASSNSALSSIDDFVRSASGIGYLEIPGIPGESKVAQHEDKIEIYGLSWASKQKVLSAGSGRQRGGVNQSPIRITKKVDAATPYLMLANWQGKSFDRVELQLQQSGASRDAYLTIKLENVIISSFASRYGDNSEGKYDYFELSFESIKVLYKEINSDGSTGDEHEVEYDIVAGV